MLASVVLTAIDTLFRIYLSFFNAGNTAPVHVETSVSHAYAFFRDEEMSGLIGEYEYHRALITSTASKKILITSILASHESEGQLRLPGEGLETCLDWRRIQCRSVVVTGEDADSRLALRTDDRFTCDTQIRRRPG